jgi:predicted PurR-regulated permease PerM
MMPILAIAAATAFFYYASPILIPIVMATALTYLLLPVVDALKRLKLSHTAAVAIVMIIVLGIFVLLVILLIGQLGDLAVAMPQYKARIEAALNTLQEYVGEYLIYLPGDLGTGEDLSVDMKQLQQAGQYIFKGLGSMTHASGFRTFPEKASDDFRQETGRRHTGYPLGNQQAAQGIYSR